MTNVDKVVIIKPLNDVSSSPACSISLLLIHALRTGHVSTKSIESLLQTTLARRDHMVQWINESDPVIPQIKRTAFLDFSAPVPAQQVGATLRNVEFIAGILAQLQSHDLRAGCARDLSKLPAGQIKGLADEGVAKALGHSRKSLHHDVTDCYIGEIKMLLNLLIAENAKLDSFGSALIDEGYQNRLLQSSKVQEYYLQNKLDPQVRRNRKIACRRIHQSHQDNWISIQKNLLSALKTASPLKK